MLTAYFHHWYMKQREVTYKKCVVLYNLAVQWNHPYKCTEPLPIIRRTENSFYPLQLNFQHHFLYLDITVQDQRGHGRDQRRTGRWIAECGIPNVFSAAVADIPSIYEQVISHYLYHRLTSLIMCNFVCIQYKNELFWVYYI